MKKSFKTMSTQARTSILTIFSAVKATQGIMQMMQNWTITGKFETIWLQKRRRIIHLQCHHWTSFSLCLRISIMNIRMNSGQHGADFGAALCDFLTSFFKHGSFLLSFVSM